MMALGTLGGSVTSAHDLNEAGHVVGGSHTAEGKLRAFFWTPERGMENLGAFGGAFSVALSVNDHDQVTGYSTTPEAEIHAFLWSRATGMQDLGTLGGDFSWGFDINNVGEIAGRTSLSPGDGVLLQQGIVWRPEEGMTLLGTLGGPFSSAQALNELGFLVGIAATPTEPVSDTAQAFVWSEADGMLNLGALPGDPGSAAYDMNSRGQVVGASGGGFDFRPVLWTLSIPELPPAAHLAALTREVLNLGRIGALNQGQLQALLATLEVVRSFVEAGLLIPAERLLESFVRQVRARVISGTLPEASGNSLIEKAEMLLGILS
jgi:probable HAF family extracellular repeat protein